MHETATVFNPLFKIAWIKSIFCSFGQDITRRDKTVRHVFISSIFLILFVSFDLMHDMRIEIFLMFKILKELIYLSVSQSIRLTVLHSHFSYSFVLFVINHQERKYRPYTYSSLYRYDKRQNNSPCELKR